MRIVINLLFFLFFNLSLKAQVIQRTPGQGDSLFKVSYIVDQTEENSFWLKISNFSHDPFYGVAIVHATYNCGSRIVFVFDDLRIYPGRDTTIWGMLDEEPRANCWMILSDSIKTTFESMQYELLRMRDDNFQTDIDLAARKATELAQLQSLSGDIHSWYKTEMEKARNLPREQRIARQKEIVQIYKREDARDRVSKGLPAVDVMEVKARFYYGNEYTRIYGGDVIKLD